MQVKVKTGNGTYERTTTITLSATTGDSRSPVTTPTSISYEEAIEALRLAINSPAMFFEEN